MAKNRPKIGQQITKVFEELVDEYLHDSKKIKNPLNSQTETLYPISNFDSNNEYTLIKDFLSSQGDCQKSCKDNHGEDEIAKARKEFRELRWVEKNMFMLSQLNIFARYSDKSRSARQTKTRVRQKFDYHISIDRPVCFDIFLFYYGETIERLKRLQKHKLEVGISTTVHGNTGRSPTHAGENQDKNDIKIFIINYAAVHGMPYPGRDLRHGQGRLRILLPSVLNYISVHHAYELSLQSQNKPSVGYCSDRSCWIDTCPHIVFSKPRTDLCMTCENFKKEINKIAADLDEKRFDSKSKIYRQALEHIDNAKKERTYYTACSKLAEKHYLKLGLKNIPTRSKPNSRNVMQHYSWDFAQQLHYPYEDQQVGPIYFKTPRKAQLFGVCCEGIPHQTNYLIS